MVILILLIDQPIVISTINSLTRFESKYHITFNFQKFKLAIKTEHNHSTSISDSDDSIIQILLNLNLPKKLPAISESEGGERLFENYSILWKFRICEQNSQ